MAVPLPLFVSEPEHTLQKITDAYERGEYTELEYRIVYLATQYTMGRPEGCFDPISGDLVSDPAYDDLVDLLEKEQPDSAVLQSVDPGAGKDPDAKTVTHDPPMTSIEKANGSEVEKAKILADWVADCYDELHPGLRNKKWGDKAVAQWDVQKDFDYKNLEPIEVFEYKLNVRGYPYDPEHLGKTFSLLYKRDGVAVRLYYKNGTLVAAGLRPRNGVDGEDVTEQVKHVKGIPLKLADGFTGGVQGELYCLRSVFERKNDEMLASGQIKVPYANERNYTTGSIRQFKDPTVTAAREISFIFHGAVSISSKVPFKTVYDRARWFASQGFEVVRVSKFEYKTLAMLEEMMPTLDYLVDGVVAMVLDLQDQEELGNHGGKTTNNPRGALAWKFRDEIAEVPLREIVPQVGRTGGLTPVLEFGKTARLAGTNVDRATGHNITFLAINHIVPGCILGIKKSGMIIPAVEYVLDKDGKPIFVKDTDEAYRKKGAVKLKAEAIKPYVYAQTCPSCGHATDIMEGAPGNFELICPNNLCPAQAVRTFAHYLRVMGVKGIGESILNKLVAAGLKSPAQFYKYMSVQLEDAGLSQRQALLAIAAIHGVNNPSQIKKNEDLIESIADARASKHKVPIWQIFASMGIYGAGETIGKALQAKFKDLDKIRQATVQEFAATEGIGTGTAHVVWEFFRDHGDIIDDLLEHLEPIGPKSGKFDNLTFCLSGGFTPNKGHWKKAIEDEGGVCKDSVGSTLDYLVEGEDAGSKVGKAKEFNADPKKNKGHKIQIIDPAQLQQMLSS
jgi:DNA ligase (NAD+)